MKNYVTMNEATTADDWKCTGGVNAGQDSYRIYESETTGEVVIQDGKDENSAINDLSHEK